MLQVFNVEALPKQAWLAVENPEKQAISLNGRQSKASRS